MKKRYLYALLFGIPGFILSAIVSLFAIGLILAIFWLVLFGDDPWPLSVEWVILLLFVIVFLATWISIIILGYRAGKRRENDPVLNRNHILASAGVTVFLILMILLQQWSVGNLGPKSDSTLCSDYCIQQGYSGSGMPPRDSGDRSCSCYDASGNEALKVPLDEIVK